MNVPIISLCAVCGDIVNVDNCPATDMCSDACMDEAIKQMNSYYLHGERESDEDGDCS